MLFSSKSTVNEENYRNFYSSHKQMFFYASFLFPWNPSGCNPNMFGPPQEAPLDPLTDDAAVAS